MSGENEIDYSSFLPEPTPLMRTAIVEYDWGPLHFRIVCVAATVRREKWNTGEMVDWLHCKAHFGDALPSEDEMKSTKTLLIPAAYITRISPGPTYHIAKGKKTKDIGVFPPDHLPPENGLGINVVDEAVRNLMMPERN